MHPLLTATDGAVISRSGPTVLVPSTTVKLELYGATSEAVVALTEGEEVGFALVHHLTDGSGAGFRPDRWLRPL